MAFIAALASAIKRQGYLPLGFKNATLDDAKDAIKATTSFVAQNLAEAAISRAPIPSFLKTPLRWGAKSFLHAPTARTPFYRRKDYRVLSRPRVLATHQWRRRGYNGQFYRKRPWKRRWHGFESPDGPVRVPRMAYDRSRYSAPQRRHYVPPQRQWRYKAGLK